MTADMLRRFGDQLRAPLGELRAVTDFGRPLGDVDEALVVGLGHVTSDYRLVHLLRMPANQAGKAACRPVVLWCGPWTHTDITELADSSELHELVVVDGEHAFSRFSLARRERSRQ